MGLAVSLAVSLAVFLVGVVMGLVGVDEGELEGGEEDFFSRRSLEMRSWIALGVAPGWVGRGC